MIEDFAKSIPKEFLKTSGSVFYSGRNAFNREAEVYILGVNPGGDPDEQASETIEWHTRKVMEQEPDDWSAYRDESWKGAIPGSWGMQPRVLHLFHRMGCSAGDVPASNIIFVRSRREADIKSKFNGLIPKFWPFHESVISTLKPKVILCFGGKAGNIVCDKLGAKTQIDEFVESNKRRWKSRAYQNDKGIKVVVATHPSIADWTAPSSDPTAMILRVMRH